MKCRVRAIAQELRVCSLALQSLCSFLHISAQWQMHSYSSRLDRELDLQGCGVLPVNIFLLQLHSVFSTHWLPASSQPTPEVFPKALIALVFMTDLLAGHWADRAEWRHFPFPRCQMQSDNAGILCCRPDGEGGHGGDRTGLQFVQKEAIIHHNSVQVSSSRGAPRVAAAEPVPFSSLKPCPTCWHCQEDKVPSVHGLVFLCEHELGGFPVISCSNSKSVEWKLSVTSKLSISMFNVCKHPCVWWYLCFVSGTHFCILPQHPWHWIFLKLEHDTLRGVLSFLMSLCYMTYHPNNVDFFFLLVSSDFLSS